MSKEADTRIIIDRLLQDIDWVLVDEDNKKRNIILEYQIRNKKTKENYFADYTLLDKYNRPIAVIEAKKREINPLSSKTQVRKYAENLRVRYVFMSNGDMHYFWDIEAGNPEPISGFYTQSKLIQMMDTENKRSLNRKEIFEFPFDRYNLAELKVKNIRKSSEYWNENTREEFLKRNKVKVLRDYQERAVQRIREDVKKGRSRFLLEMATGTGKTLTCAAIIDLFLQSKNAHRVLFLVDRLELEQQAFSDFEECFDKGNIYSSMIYKENTDNWRSAQIVVSTVQSLYRNDKYKKEFVPTDFDLLIVDEAHRCISGEAKKIYEYFVGFKVGLTATPKNYFRGINAEKLHVKNQYEFDQRALRDTYITFGCEIGKPTYRFTLEDGVCKKILVQPYAIDARTEITTKLLSKKGFSIIKEMPDSLEDSEKIIEQTFKGSNFEKTFFNEQTNISFCKTFIENAKRDPISGEIGKSIIYCVSQNHASKITNTLNKLAMEKYPNKYKSDFAIQITSNAIASDPELKNGPRLFNDDNNKLGGKSIWLEDYNTSKCRVCVTVAMMTTGYNCKDLLNIALMRPVMSPCDFIQIKGRGTRIHTFEHDGRKVRKDNFYLFDFFAVIEFFETKYKYDEARKVPRGEGTGDGEGGDEQPKPEVIELNQSDPMSHVLGAQVEKQGMRVDRDFYSIDEIKKAMLADKELRNAVNRKDWDNVVRIVKEKYAENPDFKMPSIEKLSDEFNLERVATWQDFVEIVYGIKKPKSTSELLEEAVNSCMKAFHINELKRKDIKKLIVAYIENEAVRDAIDNKHYSRFGDSGLYSFDEFKKLGDVGKNIAGHLQNYVPKELYMSA